MKIAMLLWLALTSTVPAFAQEPELVLDSTFKQRFDELAKWLREYHAWEKWFEVWGNRVERNFNGQPNWERRKRPEPPMWLAAECQGDVGVDGLLAAACDILRDWDEDPLRILLRPRSPVATSNGKVQDKVVKSSFFQRVHLTGLWMQARYPATPAYGIVGMQVGVFEIGRVTLPAIGAMIVVMPDGKGEHAWWPATTLGFGYRICDFVSPWFGRQASLHFNFARTNLHGGQDERMVPGSSNVNLFGLSVSLKRR